MTYSVKYGNLEKFMNSENLEKGEQNAMTKNEILQLLCQFGQIVFYGPPGTGKTRAAKLLLPELIGADEWESLQGDRWDIVQFHPSYNYEDFVRGVQVKTGDDKKVAYETVNRIFGEMCERAADDSENYYALIIDEINRANVSAVLGELIYALEYRGKAVKTPYLGNIVIPKNLYIIGTMNTADRTIGQIDYAVRRRFAFVHIAPDETVITNADAQKFFADVDKLFAKDSEYMSPDFDAEDVRIGHSYFLADGAELGNKIIYQVVPILREYVRDGVLLPESEKVIKEIEERAEELVKKPPSDESESDSPADKEAFYPFYWKAGEHSGVNGMGSTALNIVKRYIADYKPDSIEQFRRDFGMPDGGDFVVDVREKPYSQNYMKERIAIGRDKIQVSCRWANPESGKWNTFKECAENHGYTIHSCHFVNIGEDDKQSRSWADCRRLGFLAAGGAFKTGGGTYADGLKKLQTGEMVFAFYKSDDNKRNKGVVGFGEIVARAVPIRNFNVDGTPLLGCKDESGVLYAEKYPLASSTADDERECEWVLAVKWIKTVSSENSVPVSGQRNVVWHTVSDKSLEAIRRKFLPDSDSEE